MRLYEGKKSPVRNFEKIARSLISMIQYGGFVMRNAGVFSWDMNTANQTWSTYFSTSVSSGDLPQSFNYTENMPSNN